MYLCSTISFLSVWAVEEQRLQEEEERKVWEEEERALRLVSVQEKKWLVELAEQNWQNWLAEEKVEGSSKSGGMQKDEDRVCWGCWVWEEPCQ